jgi:hypothetical protein
MIIQPHNIKKKVMPRVIEYNNIQLDIDPNDMIEQSQNYIYNITSNAFINQIYNAVVSSLSLSQVMTYGINTMFSLPFIDMIFYFVLFILSLSLLYRIAHGLFWYALKILGCVIIFASMVLFVDFMCYDADSKNDFCAAVTYQVNNSMISKKIIQIVYSFTSYQKK